MPDMWIDVDTAVTVPVNMLPLLDDTDFKTRETAVAYNAAGMDLVWNFQTTAGVQTQTAVTPTTAGVHDWTHVGDAMYKIEIPASGGTINNDTEGIGWFTGLATGVLPWRGPVIGFRAAGLNSLLIDDTFSTTRGLAGTALPDAAADAAGGLPISDAGGLDMDGFDHYLVTGGMFQDDNDDIWWTAGCLKNGQPENSTDCTVQLYESDGDGSVTTVSGATDTATADDAQNVMNGKLTGVSLTAGKVYYLHASLTADGGTRKGWLPFGLMARAS